MKAWPLDSLLAENRNAMTVYSALRWMAGDRLQWCATRARIREVCGLGERAIGKAMQALNGAGWIKLAYGRSGQVTWYRVSFIKSEFFPVVRKAHHRGRRGTSKKVPQGTIPCGVKHVPLFPKGNIGAEFTGLEGPDESTSEANIEAEESRYAAYQNQNDSSPVEDSQLNPAPPESDHPSGVTAHYGEHPAARRERELMEAAATRRRQAGEILTPDDLPEDYRELYEERAGIREFDGTKRGTKPSGRCRRKSS